MKKNLVFLSISIFLTFSALGQKVSETDFGIGFSKTPLNEKIKQHWSEDAPPPTFLNINVSKNWYRSDRKIALQKEVGINLQNSKINVGGGGLGGGSNYSGRIINLNTEANLLLRFNVDSMISFALGPMAEYLLVGYNNINNSYYTNFGQPRSGEIRTSGINRDYYNQPSYGIKLRIINSRMNGKNTLGLDLSYLWTKSEFSNFYASNYFQVSFLIGFKNQK
jgi:hypothetical protein